MKEVYKLEARKTYDFCRRQEKKLRKYAI